jgi:prepilin signal peptidase PulO-like enzyme (type II secretory pathway)
MYQKLKDLLARWKVQPVLVVAVITFGVVAFLNPAKVGLALYGISKLTLFAFAGKWIDDRIFRNAQPEQLEGVAQGTAWKRKGLIVAASIVAGALVP